MPFLILILSALGGAIWFWVRNNPRDALNTAQDAVTTLRNAPRKFAFTRQTNQHPVEGIDDVRVAICAIVQAFIELDDLPTKEQRQILDIQLRSKLRIDAEQSEELQVLGRWILTQCEGAKMAVPRLGRRLAKIDGDASLDLIQGILMELVETELSSAQVDAIADLRRALGR